MGGVQLIRKRLEMRGLQRPWRQKPGPRVARGFILGARADDATEVEVEAVGLELELETPLVAEGAGVVHAVGQQLPIVDAP
jgi:hypothetical protein